MMKWRRWTVFSVFLLAAGSCVCAAQHSEPKRVHLDYAADGDFSVAEHGHATALFVGHSQPATVHRAAEAFAADVEKVTGERPQILSTPKNLPAQLIVFGVLDGSEDMRVLGGKLTTKEVQDRWESAVTQLVDKPFPGVRRALVVAGSDRRGAAYALLTLSRQMGVSPWTWWADVPVVHHDAIYVSGATQVQAEPSVRYRGIFLNDEDWGLRPWAAKKMDPELKNIGPHTYARVFELLLRLRANTLWPAMHPGTLAFNAVPENAKLADEWGIVMGASHSEALLRNNVGEWDEKRDGPWNYQINRAAIDRYWDQRLVENGKFENFYTIGMRGVHDTGLEATGSTEVKARLVEQVMNSQRTMLAKRVSPKLDSIPQVIWLYKESLALYRAGMKVPEDVTLGWTDDNYGYLRQLPSAAEQRRIGGSGVYYHVSYWGFPHDYLWLCTTPPALIREEMTKAYDHDARRFWMLNVGDLKPAEVDIDYFMQLAWNEPATARIGQEDFLRAWAGEQFPTADATAIGAMLDEYYRLNFIRKPEFMGFNGYNDGINRTQFNPLGWGDQNRTRLEAWFKLSSAAEALGNSLPAAYKNAFFELVGYPIRASALQNAKFLLTDRTFLDEAEKNSEAAQAASEQARAAFMKIDDLTAQFNGLAGGKWDGMMSDNPRSRQVFKMPATAFPNNVRLALPEDWRVGSAVKPGKGFTEQNATISINAAHFARSSHDSAQGEWTVLPELGISGASVVFGKPGVTKIISDANAPWLEYDFSTQTTADAMLTLHLLPTFPLVSDHHLRFTVALDGGTAVLMDLGGLGEWKDDRAPTWAANVLRNSATLALPLGPMKAGPHTLRLTYRDPAVVFQHLVLTFPGSVPAYPVPPETGTP